MEVRTAMPMAFRTHGEQDLRRLIAGDSTLTGSRICSPTSSACRTQTVVKESPFIDPITRLVCAGNAWSAATLYQTIAEVSNTGAASSATSTRQTGITSTSAPDPTAPPASGASTTPTVHKKSQAWIAGAVIGPLAGLALLGALFFLWKRKSRNTPVAGAAGGHEPTAHNESYTKAQMAQQGNAAPVYAHYEQVPQQGYGQQGFGQQGPGTSPAWSHGSPYPQSPQPGLVEAPGHESWGNGPPAPTELPTTEPAPKHQGING
jgi:hypothetical protein